MFLLPVWKSNTIHLSFALPLAWYYVVQDSVPIPSIPSIPAIPAIDMVLLWLLLLSCPVLGSAQTLLLVTILDTHVGVAVVVHR